MKQKILIIVLSDLRHDARVRRQVNALSSDFEVTVVAFNGSAHDGYRLIMLPPSKLTFRKKAFSSFFLLSGLYNLAYKILHNYKAFVHSATADQKFDLIIANDVETLPVAFSFPYKPKVLFDAHEYAPRHFEDKRWWRIFFRGFNTWLCRKYIPKVSAVTTVGKGLAYEYEKNFKVRPRVITNAHNYAELQPSPMTEGRIRLVHHGIVNPSRSLHLMVEMIGQLDERFSLDIYLLIPGFASARTMNYLEELKQKASRHPNIRILPPIPGNELVTKLNEYDMGVFLLPPVNFNYENTLPNKLFDFIQARLGIAIGPTPEMADIVRTFDNGVISKEFTAESLAEELKKLSFPDVKRFKENSAKAAKVHNAENNAHLIKQMVKQILN